MNIDFLLNKMNMKYFTLFADKLVMKAFCSIWGRSHEICKDNVNILKLLLLNKQIVILSLHLYLLADCFFLSLKQWYNVKFIIILF